MPSQGFTRSILLVGALAASTGCDGPPTTAPEPADIRPFVTGAAERSLDGAGLFVLPEATSPSTKEIITEERARQLTASYVRSFGPVMKRHWDEDRGRPVDLATLAVRERLFFAATPYELVEDGYHPATRRALGPYYIVSLGRRDEPEVIVATAAYNEEIGINAEGGISLPRLSGMEFISRGVALDTTQSSLPYVLTPEQAVIRVGQMTGARTSEVPRLVQMAFPLGPLYPAWRLVLDREVQVRTRDGGRTAHVRTLYLGREQGRELLIPSAEQPSHIMVAALSLGPDGNPLDFTRIRVAVRPGEPTEFEVVDVVGAPN